jgi:hypothetical protein
VTQTSGSVVRNTIVVTASASDNIGVSSVMFLVNNQRIGNDDTTAPFEVTWDTTTVPNGSYTLAAVAKDAYGNATSTSISVTVANDAQAPSVAITSPASAAQVSFREQVPDGASGRKTAWLATLRTRQTT